MALEKEIIVLGDIEMGAGSLTDDFISDKALSELILELVKRPHPVDLGLNGDTFDFLKCPYFQNNALIYPRHITPDVSLTKLNLIYHAHQKVFRALEKFTQSRKNRLFFTIGNHDFDLVYKEVQKDIKKLIGNHKNIYFLLKYRCHGVYVEHGQQYDFLNKINFRKLFLTYKNKLVLNLPYTSLGLISYFMHLKEEHPFLERVFPRHTLFSFHHSVVKKMTFRGVSYFFKSILYYPFRYYSDPTYTFPRNLFSEFYRRIKQFNWDVDDIVHVFKRKRKKLFSLHKIYVLGHIHEKYIEDKEGVVILHPGSWRDEYDLIQDTRQLICRQKRYIQILVNAEDKLDYQLIVFPLQRSVLNFDQVVKNERYYLKKAAEEES